MSDFHNSFSLVTDGKFHKGDTVRVVHNEMCADKFPVGTVHTVDFVREGMGSCDCYIYEFLGDDGIFYGFDEEDLEKV